jgi:hypothetical protein
MFPNRHRSSPFSVRNHIPFRAVLGEQVTTTLDVWQEGECVACHEHCCERWLQVLNLEHYLEVLERKPGALAGSTSLAQWREQGRSPASYDQLWQELIGRQGKAEGTRRMVRLLHLGKQKGYARLQAAVESVLALGCGDEEAVRYLMLAESENRRAQGTLEVGCLNRYERPLPVVNDYDQLLAGEVRR